jgi:hypothetical protein
MTARLRDVIFRMADVRFTVRGEGKRFAISRHVLATTPLDRVQRATGAVENKQKRRPKPAGVVSEVGRA